MYATEMTDLSADKATVLLPMSDFYFSNGMIFDSNFIPIFK